MDENRQVSEATEELISRELRALLKAEPSPEFLPRLRQRIAAEPVAPIWNVERAPVRVLALAATVGVLLIALFPRDTQHLSPQSSASLPFTSNSVPSLTTSARVDSISPATVPAQPERTLRPAAPMRPVEYMEVLVPLTEIAATRDLISAAHEGRFPFELMGDAVPVAQEITDPGGVAVPPITLMPVGAGEL